MRKIILILSIFLISCTSTIIIINRSNLDEINIDASNDVELDSIKKTVPKK